MREWYIVSDLIGLPGLPGTTQGIRKKAGVECWKKRPVPKGKGFEYHISSLPQQTQTYLTRQLAASKPAKYSPTEREDREAMWVKFGAAPQNLKSIAEHRLEVMQMYRHLMQSGESRSSAASAIYEKFRVGQSSLARWRKMVHNVHGSDWLAYLLPTYKGGTQRADLAPEAWDYIKADYLRMEAPTFTSCFRRLVRISTDEGWELPSEKTVKRRLDSLPRDLRILSREGPDGLKAFYPHQDRDRSVFHALQGVNADGHKFDVFVEYPDGEIGRPVMVAWQDLYSGKILSWRMDKTENTDAVRLSFGDLVEEFGIPEHAYLDNGRGFASKWMTGGIPNRYRFKVKEDEPSGLLKTLDVEVHWATPYHGQAKPIERAFRDLATDISKHPAFAGAYTGNSVENKPENYGTKAVPFDEFLKVVETEINEHNLRLKRRTDACGGVHSFDFAFNQSYAKAQIRKATQHQKSIWLLAAEAIKASARNGEITLQVERRNRYWSPEISEYAGQKLIVRFDPLKLHEEVQVYTLNNVFIGTAPCVARAGFNDSQAAREHNRDRRQFINAAKAQQKAQIRMTAREAAKMLPDDSPETETPSPKVVRPIFAQNTSLAVAHDYEEDIDHEAHKKHIAKLKAKRGVSLYSDD